MELTKSEEKIILVDMRHLVVKFENPVCPSQVLVVTGIAHFVENGIHRPSDGSHAASPISPHLTLSHLVSPGLEMSHT